MNYILIVFDKKYIQFVYCALIANNSCLSKWLWIILKIASYRTQYLNRG